MLLEVGRCNQKPVELLLAEGERILGIKSLLRSKGNNPYHDNLQFVIGRLDG